MFRVRDCLLFACLLGVSLFGVAAEQGKGPPVFNYQKRVVEDLSEVFAPKMELMVPMRDGVRLHTEVYIPKGIKTPLPIILERTAYVINPGEQPFSSRLALYSEFFKEGFIFAFQDTRGRVLSEGVHVPIRPQAKPGEANATDESTDYYDTIDWLVKNVPNNNGRVGTLGISYGGFLTTRAMIKPHPALKAASPQAACADMFMGDDFFHNGAFRLNYAFAVALSFDMHKNAIRSLGKRDEYEAYLGLGSLSKVNETFFEGGKSRLWNAFENHPVYDDTWRYEVCGVLPYMTEPTVPTLNVLGWYDMEDFYGPMQVYKQMEKKDRKNHNYLIVGPWYHGSWTMEENQTNLGPFNLGYDAATDFRTRVHVPWFTYWLKQKGKLDFPEVAAYQMGSNEWQHYDTWPPKSGIEQRELYLLPSGKLSFKQEYQSSSDTTFDSYVSDPAKPVPYRARPSYYPYGWETWFLEDQRFVSDRPDVLTWVSEPLDEDLSITGEPIAKLFASTSGTDSDWVVKLIDVFPDDLQNWDLSGYRAMVAGEVFRARFRESFEKPTPVVADKVTEYAFSLRDRNHRFLKGHRIMVQIQSSWFPVIDRNPQTFVPNIFKAQNSDFKPATQRIYRSSTYPSRITLPVNVGNASASQASAGGGK